MDVEGNDMKRKRWGIAGFVALVIVSVVQAVRPESKAAAPDGTALPTFQVDASWPKMPGKMIVGALGGIEVDAHDHIWVLNRFRTLTKGETYAAQTPPMAECCVPAPPVLEFD